MQVSEAFICKLVPSRLPDSRGYSGPNECAKLGGGGYTPTPTFLQA